MSSPSTGSDEPRGHEPVLLAETMELLAVKAGGLYVDGTVGLGGHTREILRRSAPDGRVIGLDRDSETLDAAREALAEFGSRVELHHDDFRRLPAVLASHQPDGVLLDLGINSRQLDTAERGFSFQREGPLDMRMDRSQVASARDLVNRLPENELADLIYEFGEERASRRIARAIARSRALRPLETTSELAEVIRRVMPRSRHARIDPATRTFQALRIAVNRELDSLGAALEQIANTLRPAGRLVVIAFHSLEDREVKHCFRALSGHGFLAVTRKPMRASEEEERRNPRSRSARLRAIERRAA